MFNELPGEAAAGPATTLVSVAVWLWAPSRQEPWPAAGTVPDP